MSAIAALLSLDGGWLGPAEITAMTASMADRGPDGLNVWQQGAVALGHASLRVLPEDVAPQPVRHAASGSAIVFDGRIDARDELAAACGIDPGELTDLSDGALLLRAYLTRGAAVLSDLLGDFAFALWDAPNSRLICGRDVLGLRPLYYTVRDREMAVASELQAVLRGRAARPNLGVVAETLTSAITSRDETLFAGVFRVLPGHALVSENAQWRVVRFVRLEAPAPLVYATEAEYFEHFREVFLRAVRDRLRTTSKAAVMLSGGVDSGIVYAAARAVADVDGYTVGCDDGALDETAVARAVVALNGGRHHRAASSAAAYDYANEIDRYRDLPTNPSGGNSAALRRKAAGNRVNVLLNGVGGDECFLGHAGRWADWLRDGRWPLLWRELKSWHDSWDRVPWAVLARTTVQPLIPPAMRRAASALRPGRQPFPWVSRSLLRETHLFERLRRVPDERGPSHALTGTMHSMIDAEAVAAWEAQDRIAARFHQDERMPYFDRRVITFALSIPETLRSRPGSPKYVTRSAWADRLPANMVNALDAPDHTLQVVDALEALGGAARLDALGIADAGWIERDVVRTMTEQLLSTARTSRRFLGHAWKLWAIVTLDDWYRRALDAREPARAIAARAAFD